MNDRLRRAIVVDAVSTGKELAPALRSRGIRSIHVQSLPALPQPVRLSDFERHILYAGDLDALANELAPLAPEFVIPGCEQGVLLADALSAAMQLPGNGTAQSLPRRNKLRLAERLRSCGVRAVPTFEATTPAEAMAAAASIGAWPVVVKPVDSSGSDGLHFCPDMAAVRAAAQGLLGRINFAGSLNRSVIVQRLIRGQQYDVLAVGRDGRHFVCEIWRDDRRPIPGAGVMPDLAVLLPPEGELVEELSRYACACLDALEIRIGPSFLEIIVTPEGPVLIDLAARMMGTQDFALSEAVLGASQLSLTTACYADPAAFAAQTAQPLRLRTHFWVVTLLQPAGRAGHLVDESWREQLQRLPSFRSALGMPEPGQLIRPTVDEATSPGAVFLLHDDPAQLDRDYRGIRALESQGLLFRTEPALEAS